MKNDSSFDELARRSALCAYRLPSITDPRPRSSVKVRARRALALSIVVLALDVSFTSERCDDSVVNALGEGLITLIVPMITGLILSIYLAITNR